MEMFCSHSALLIQKKRVAVACLTVAKCENEKGETVGEKKDLCPEEMASKMGHILKRD